MVAFGLQQYFDAHWPGKVMTDPRPLMSFSPNRLVKKECWYRKSGFVGWKLETRLRITAACSSQLDLTLYCPNKTSIVREGVGERW